MPLAKRLITTKRPKTKEQADAMKKAALAFLSEAIDHAFPLQTLPKSLEIISATLIDIAFNLCKKLDRLPTKKEVRMNSPWWNGMDKQAWRRRFDAAGLKGLPSRI